jgi:hypothetical protein
MNGDALCADADEFLDVPFRSLNQKVKVKDQIGGFAQTLHHWLAHAELGNKVPIHHIHVNHGCPSFSKEL